MTQNLNTSAPARTRNRSLYIALIVMGLTVIALTIALLVNRSSAPQPSPSTAATPSASAEATSTPTSPMELKAPTPQVKELVEAQWRLKDDDPMARGKVDAALVIQVYYDFRCGYCAMGAVQTEPKLERYIEDGTVRVEYHNLPVLGPESVLLAQGSLAAANQGKFLDYHSLVFKRQFEKNPVTPTEDGLVDVAKEIGVPDLDKFRTDMTSEEIRDAVEKARVHGTQKLGITGTPAFIVGYSYVPGFIPPDTVDKLITAELARPKA